jgi:glycosyltransferase involved in cell wall biosynthesis
MTLKSRKVVFLTNLPAPYRFPIWDRMAGSIKLKVFFLLKKSNWRKWTAPANVTWEYEFLGFRSFRFDEYEIVPHFWGIKRVLRDADAVIIGSWEIPFYMRAIYFSKKSDIPIIQIYESTEKSQRFKSGFLARFRALLIKKAQIVVTFGSDSTQAVLNMGVSKEVILELFNPVDVSWFHEYSVKNRVQETPGHKYLYVGQLIERKNLYNMIDAFKIVSEQHDTLTVVGDGRLLDKLQEYVKHNSLQDKVFFSGPKNACDLASIYSRSNTLILASVNEVWGLVVNEALACGMHVVVSKNTGVSAFVSGMPGVYISETDAISISMKMKESKSDWKGFLTQHSILDYTPERFADELIERMWQKIFKLNEPNSQ